MQQPLGIICVGIFLVICAWFLLYVFVRLFYNQGLKLLSKFKILKNVVVLVYPEYIGPNLNSLSDYLNSNNYKNTYYISIIRKDKNGGRMAYVYPSFEIGPVNLLDNGEVIQNEETFIAKWFYYSDVNGWKNYKKEFKKES